MTTIVKKHDSHFMSDIGFQRAVTWLSENVGPLETDIDLSGKAWGNGWFAIHELLRGDWTTTYLVDDEMLALQFKLIHG